MARRELTGALLVGGVSTRFGSPKALARLGDETLAERAWRTLGELCDERIAVGKVDDGLDLPFALVDDATDVRAPIAGLVAALRAARHDVCVVLPVDCPLVTVGALGELANACGKEVDAAVPQTGPLPGAYRATALPALETALAEGRLAIKGVLEALRVAVVELDPALLLNVNSPEELRRPR